MGERTVEEEEEEEDEGGWVSVVVWLACFFF